MTWSHACLTAVCASESLNFTVTLEEDSHRVVIAYGQMTASSDDGARGINATVGLVDDPIGCPSDQVFSNERQKSLSNYQFIPVVDR